MLEPIILSTTTEITLFDFSVIFDAFKETFFTWKTYMDKLKYAFVKQYLAEEHLEASLTRN